MIAAVCPHCDMALQLKPEMAGRQVRCPNPDCQETYTVPSAVPAPPPVPPPPVVLTARPVAPPPVAVLRPKTKEVRWTPEPSAAPREVRWEDTAAPAPPPVSTRPPRPIPLPPPPPPRRPGPKPAPERDPEPDVPIRRRAKAKNRSPMILAGLVSLLAFGAGGLGASYLVRAAREESRLREEAETAYAAGEYANARTKFEKLAADHADGDHGPRYAFLAKLSASQAAVLSVRAGGSPADELPRFLKFLADSADDPLAKPGSGFGNDIVLLGQKLTGLAHDHAEGELKRYGIDRDGKRLAESERIAADGREALARLERFRDKDSPASTEVVQKYDALGQTVRGERKRADAVAAQRGLLDGATYENIAKFEEAMRQAGLGADAEVQGLAAAARKKRLDNVKFRPGREAPAALTLDPEPGLAAAFAAGSPKPTADGATETVFGLAAGGLYALDATTGRLLWARRIAAATADRATFDLPVRFARPDGDGILVNVRHGGAAGMAALAVRTGQPLWFQPLPAAGFARPAVVGERAYVGLRDPEGTIVEIDLATGEKLGAVPLGLPLAAAPVAIPGERAGSGYVLGVCESERAILLRIDGPEPAFAKSFFTGHAAGAVLCEPAFVETPEGPRLFLALASGAARSVFAGYRLPPRAAWADGAAEVVPSPLPPKGLDGWPWFPPITDVDRLAFVTDAGRVRWYGTAAAEPYPLLPEAPAAIEEPSRAAALALDEDSLWAVVGSKLMRYRAVVGRQGLEMKEEKDWKSAPAVGEATARPQRTASVVVANLQPAGGGRPQVLAFDPDSGAVRWRVELIGEGK